PPGMAENGPRTIDIDILFHGNFVVDTTDLTIPHPRFSERRFVLAPMVELASELRESVSRRTMCELAGGTAGQAVSRRSEGRLTAPGCTIRNTSGGCMRRLLYLVVILGFCVPPTPVAPSSVKSLHAVEKLFD